MKILKPKGTFILARDSNRGRDGWAILELLAQFGYMSLQEVIYGLGITHRKAIDRMRYLERCGFVQKFSSHTVPANLFCLTLYGRKLVRVFNISAFISRFTASRYCVQFLTHHRHSIQVYSAFKHILGHRFQGWEPEELLRRESGSQKKVFGDPANRRIWDGLMHVEVSRTRCREEADGFLQPVGEPETSVWRCAIELELSIKSSRRYRQQFDALASEVYDVSVTKQVIPMVVFVCGSKSIRDCLVNHLSKQSHNYGRCVFYLGLMDELLKSKGYAQLLKIVHGKQTTIRADRMAHLNVLAKRQEEKVQLR